MVSNESGMAGYTASGPGALRAPGEIKATRSVWLRCGWLLVLLLTLVGAPLADSRPTYAAPLGRVTARLGISAGDAIQEVPLGLRGRELRQRIPILFQTADRLNVDIEDASVGQGFFADNGVLLSEKDLDLVVTGRRDRITTMAATLGKAFLQSVVFVWFFDDDSRTGQITASIPLPGGAEALTTEVYQQLVAELADGGHVRYAGRGLLFVANTGGEPEPAFFARMERVRALLARVSIPTAPARCQRAQFLAIDRDSYDQIIVGRPSQTAAPVAAPASGARDRGERRCA